MGAVRGSFREERVNRREGGNKRGRRERDEREMSERGVRGSGVVFI